MLNRYSRFGKIGLLSAIGGSIYIFKDELKPIYKLVNKSTTDSTQGAQAILPNKRNIENLPDKIPFLLVGGGAASHSAMRAIRGHDAQAKVLILTSENQPPYMRPALSKELWFTDKDLRKSLTFKWWNGKERSIFYEIDEFYLDLKDMSERENGGVSLVKNMRLSKLDPDQNIAHLENGQQIKYGKCLLATGGRPKTLPAIDAASDDIKQRVIYFRTADDFLKLDKISSQATSIAIIGGGFLGSELTFALSARPAGEGGPKDQKIYQIMAESGNLDRVLPKYLSEYVTEKVKQQGAHVLPNVDVESVSESSNGSIDIKLGDGKIVQADYIVCAIGIEPDVDLARASGLEVDQHTGGYLVNSELQSRSNVWVAGDASCFYDVKLGRRRVEHHDHALNSGRLAGQNMTGAGKIYSHQPMFWSDLGPDLSFEAVGLIDANLPTVAVFTKEQINKEAKQATDDANTNSQGEDTIDKLDKSKIQEPNQQDSDEKYPAGVVFYLKDDVIVGVLLWNVFNRLRIARRILHEQKKYDDYNEVAKLFSLYAEEE